MPENLTQLRLQYGWSKVQAARALRLGTDVWQKFEQGSILPKSLSSAQALRLAEGFGVSADQFLALLAGSRSQPVILCHRAKAASAPAEPTAQSFAQALGCSAMPAADKHFWNT